MSTFHRNPDIVFSRFYVLQTWRQHCPQELYCFVDSLVEKCVGFELQRLYPWFLHKSIIVSLKRAWEVIRQNFLFAYLLSTKPWRPTGGERGGTETPPNVNKSITNKLHQFLNIKTLLRVSDTVPGHLQGVSILEDVYSVVM